MDNPMDINQASLEDLVTLPGVTPELAERLIAARPFQTPEDLRRVKGMNSRLVKRLKPYLAFPELTPASEGAEETPPPAPMIASEAAPPATEEVQASIEVPLPPASQPEKISAEVREPAVPPEPVTLPPPAVTPETSTPAHETIAPLSTFRQLTRNETLIYAGLFSLLAFTLAMIFSLGFLAIINGGLRYISPGRFNALQSRVELLNSQITTLQQDVNALRLRVETMEALSGRVSNLEKETETLRNELETTATQMKQLQEEFDRLDQQVSTLQKSVQIFERFLQGLRTLLADLAPASP